MRSEARARLRTGRLGGMPRLLTMDAPSLVKHRPVDHTRTRFEDVPEAEAWYKPAYDDLDRVLAFTEMKTIWHPARI